MAEHLSFAKHYANYPGKTLGNYYLEQLSEEVETGPIFLARPTNAQTKQFSRLRLLALPAGLTPEERLLYLGHFQREASQVAVLQHPALLPLSDYGIFEGTPYLISPALSAFSLHSMLTKNGPVETRLAGRYLDQIAAVLEYAHQQGILHLNLNARNVFIQADGQLLVADFGLIRMLGPQMPAATGTEQRLELENGSPLLRDQQGKPLYGLNLASAPAPELLRGQPPTTSTDVYALAALLYYLLTGHRPWRGQTLAEIAHQHLNAAIPPLSTRRPGLPLELDRLLSSALAKDPTRRLHNPGTLANAYAGIVAPDQSGRKAFAIPVPTPAPTSQPAALQPPTGISAHPTPGPALSRRRTLTLIAASGGIAAAGIAVWLVAHNTSSATSIAGSNNNSSAPSTTANTGSQGTASGSSPSGHRGVVVANASDMPLNSAKTFPIANSNNPGVLIHLQNNQFVAFNSTCTHAGCAVAYNRQNQLLECPCHSASFDPARNAIVTGGPAPSPLTAIAITVNNDGTITTGR